MRLLSRQDVRILNSNVPCRQPDWARHLSSVLLNFTTIQDSYSSDETEARRKHKAYLSEHSWFGIPLVVRYMASGLHRYAGSKASTLPCIWGGPGIQPQGRTPKWREVNKNSWSPVHNAGHPS